MLTVFHNHINKNRIKYNKYIKTCYNKHYRTIPSQYFFKILYIKNTIV